MVNKWRFPYKLVKRTSEMAKPVDTSNQPRGRVVPSELTWAEINPRPMQYQGPSDVRTLQAKDLCIVYFTFLVVWSLVYSDDVIINHTTPFDFHVQMNLGPSVSTSSSVRVLWSGHALVLSLAIGHLGPSVMKVRIWTLCSQDCINRQWNSDERDRATETERERGREREGEGELWKQT